MWTYRLTANSFLVIRLFVSVILYTHMTQLSIFYVLLTPAISKLWTDLRAASWLVLLIFGMSSQLILSFKRGFWMVHHIKRCAALCVCLSCIVFMCMRFITVKNVVKCRQLLVCKGEIELFNNHQSTCGHLKSLRNKQ